MSLFSCSYSFSLYKSRKPYTLSWYAKYCKSERNNLVRWRFAFHLSCSTDWNTGNGNILPFFASLRKTKNPDFVWKSGFYCFLLFFKVVPPATESRFVWHYFSISYIFITMLVPWIRFSQLCTVRHQFVSWVRFLNAKLVI